MNYFDIQEKKDSILLEEFNDDLHWFKGLSGNPQYSEVDYKATDAKNRLVHLELKQRKGNINQYLNYGDILIEPSKVSAFSKIMESGFTNGEKVLYVNFVDDGIIIFDIDKIPYYKNYPNHKQINFGKQKVEHETRLGIPMSCAIVFKKEKGKYTRYRQYEKDNILS